MKQLLTIFLVLSLVISCESKKNNDSIVGLWEVTKVAMGDQEMTPVAKWIRFNDDFTQESGNGWVQHSVGNWTLDPTTNQLRVNNTNGMEDKIPFEVNLTGNSMMWKRIEFGEEVVVSLNRIDQIPTAEANKLLGGWKFQSIVVDGKDVSDSLNPNNKAMLYLAWDHAYRLRNYPEGEKFGIYRTHGHMQRIEMMLNYNSKDMKMQAYFYEFDGDTLTFKATNKEEELQFTRIHNFFD